MENLRHLLKCEYLPFTKTLYSETNVVITIIIISTSSSSSSSSQWMFELFHKMIKTFCLSFRININRGRRRVNKRSGKNHSIHITFYYILYVTRIVFRIDVDHNRYITERHFPKNRTKTNMKRFPHGHNLSATTMANKLFPFTFTITTNILCQTNVPGLITG